MYEYTIETFNYTNEMAGWIKDIQFVYTVYGMKDTILFFTCREDMTAFKLRFKV